MKSRKAKFFCENCGAEVPQNAKFCRNCGRFFASVRCPSCGFIGIADSFSKGCPSCGYADSEHRKINPPSFSNKKVKSGDASLPVWIYLFTIGALTGIFVAIIFLYVR